MALEPGACRVRSTFARGCYVAAALTVTPLPPISRPNC